MKLYIHPQSKFCSQELYFQEYEKYVPLTRKSIPSIFNIVNNIEDCDYIFLGQICEGRSISQEFVDICNKHKRKVIVDIEGDFGSSLFHPCFRQVTTCAGGPDKRWGLESCFVRPHLSKVLIELFESKFPVKNTSEKKLNFFFQGQINVLNRVLMIESFMESRISNVVFNLQPTWGANKSIRDSDYCQTMNDNLLSLCPRGVGGSSIRLYESCYFGCVPIVLGSDKMMAEDEYDTSFAFKLENYNNKFEIIKLIKTINESEKQSLIEIGVKARKYYNEVVAPYLASPTKQFVNWIQNNEN